MRGGVRPIFIPIPPPPPRALPSLPPLEFFVLQARKSSLLPPHFPRDSLLRALFSVITGASFTLLFLIMIFFFFHLLQFAFSSRTSYAQALNGKEWKYEVSAFNFAHYL